MNRRLFFAFLLLVGWIILPGRSVMGQPRVSVLATGNWLKISIVQPGVYRIDRATLARISPAMASADPRQLRLFGNGGAALPQPNSQPRPDDLTENAIEVTGEADGRFDEGDALLFYGQPPTTVFYDSTARRFAHQRNPYTDTTHYFLTIGPANGLRISTQPAGLSTGSAITTFTDYSFHESEENKLPTVHSGREWLGEYLGLDTDKSFSTDWPGLVANAPLTVTTGVAVGSVVPTIFRWTVNGQVANTNSVGTISGYRYDYQARKSQQTTIVSLANTSSPLRLVASFDRVGNTSAQAYIDFWAMQGQRDLRLYAQPTLLRAWPGAGPVGRFTVRSAPAGLRVWDMSNPLRPVSQAVATTGTDAAWTGDPARQSFLVFSNDQAQAPPMLRPVANQNLHGAAAPNLLIVTPAAFRTEAERLATFRRIRDGMTVLVVTTEQVYNEFASGQPDPTAIRDAARYFFRQQPGTLRYLLLFGDATYDYRNQSKALSTVDQANTVPIYESRESLHPVLSYSSDDYFGFMQPDAGDWPEDEGGDLRLDLGVGRLPVKSVAEARTVVDKLIRYGTDRSTAGDWQTRVLLVADDGDDNLHQTDADNLANLIQAGGTGYRPERAFLDDLPQTTTATGQKSPAMNARIDRAVTDGRLIVNYTGHGGESGWAEEQILTIADILGWRNRRLPLLLTATCSFGRYDDPAVNSGAELVLLSPAGGAIGLLTTTRPVYASSNYLLNRAFYQSVFTPVGGRMPRLGDVMRETKNNSLSGSLNRNFALLGDPSMTLAYPEANVTLTSINGKNITDNQTDTLRAMQSVNIQGIVQTGNSGQPLADFSGTVAVTVYDKAARRTTLGTESQPMTYRAFDSPLYAGRVPVTSGRFALHFVLPRDIDYQFGPGQVYAYALRSDSLLSASGNYGRLVVGGSATAPPDTQPPSLTLDLPDAAPGETPLRVTGPDVTLRVRLTDDTGINISRAGVGHELTIQLNGQPAVILNDSYVATSTDGRQGEARYTFRGLAPGDYTVQATAWDVGNNPARGALTFRVSARPGLAVLAWRNDPNPLREQTTLTLTHNRPGDALTWTWHLIDLAGRMLSQQTGSCADCPATLPIGTWDGTGAGGQPLSPGVYLARLLVTSGDDGSQTTAFRRLVLVK